MESKKSINSEKRPIPTKPGSKMITYDEGKRQVGGTDKSDKMPTKNVIKGGDK